MSQITIPGLPPNPGLLTTALLETSQAVVSYKTTVQQVLDLVIVANVGGGSGIFKDRTTNTFNLKSLVAGTNITLTPGTDTITIASTAGGSGITSINADTTAAQILAGTANRISLVDAGATHTFDIDAAYVGQTSITTLGLITTGTWTGTAIAYANLNLTGLVVNADISGSAAIQFSKLESLTSGNILVGSAGNVATSVTMSSDATIIASGAITIGNDKITTVKILDDNVTYAKIQNVTATSRFLGRITAGAGIIEEMTGTQSTTLLDVFTDALKGLVPLSGGGTTNFLRADGTWAVPPGGSTLPVVDTTSIVEGSADATKELRFEVDGNATGVIGVIATTFSTAKTITIPDATDTLMGKQTADVMINKSLDANGTGNVITNIGDAETETFTTTKISTLSKTLLNSAIVYNDQANVYGDFLQTFKDNQLKINSPDDADGVTLVNSNQTANRNLTIPILTGNRNFVVTGEASQIVIGTEVTGASTALTDTADIAYLNTANIFIAGNKNTFAHSATTAGLNVAPVAGTPSGQANGDIWLNVTSQQLFARINGANVDLGAAAAGGGGGTGINETIVKADTDTRTSTTTFALDDELVTSSLPVGEYTFEAKLFPSSLAAEDFKYRFDGSATMTGDFGMSTWSHDTSFDPVPLLTSIVIPGVSGSPVTTAVDSMVIVTGYFVVTVAGTFGLEWAQDISGTEGTVLFKGSSLTVKATSTGGGSSPPFDDATAIVKGSVTDTKLLRFEVDGFTAATTRVITPPDANITLVNTTDGLIANANVAAAAAIAYSKLAALTDGNILVGSAANVATSVNPTGDIDISNTGVFSINSGVIVDADINGSAAIATAKLADSANFVLSNQANTYTAGTKQSFVADATTAGLNINNQVPSTTVGGDIWRTVDALTYRNNADTLDLVIATLTDIAGKFDTAGTGLTSSGTTVNAIGTASRISVSADAIDIDSGYVGQASITTLGLITTGTWTGTTIAVANGGTGVTTSTGTVNVVLSNSPTIVTPTIASFANATHDHQAAAGGGTLLSTAALSDTATIAYLNTANVYTAGTRQDFLGLLAGTAGLNVGEIAGNPTTQVNGDLWINSSSNTLFARINGADVDLGAAATSLPVVDTTSIVEGSADATKELRFEVDGNATGVIGVIATVFTTAKTITIPDATDTLVGKATTDTLTNKSIDAANNTLTGISGITGLGAQAQDLDMSTSAIVFGDDPGVPAATVAYITHIASGMAFNVPSGDIMGFHVNAVSQLQLSNTTVDIMGNIFQLDTNQTIVTDAGGLTYNVPTADTHDFNINAVNILSVAATTINAPAATFQEAGVNISPIGLHDVWMGAGACVPVDSGAVASRLIGTTTNRKGIVYSPFITAVVRFAVFTVTLPRNFDNGTLTVVPKWTSQVEGAGTVIWSISAVAASDGDDLTAAATNYGTAQTSTDTQTTIDQEQIGPRTAAITIANTPVDADTLYIKVARDGVTDTFTQSAQLMGIYYDLTTDAAVSA